MPKIWLPNIDEVVTSFSSWDCTEKSLKYLWSLSEDDVALSPEAIDPSFLNYISAYKGFSKQIEVCVPQKDKGNNIIERLLYDEPLLDFLKRKSGYTFSAFFATSLLLEVVKKGLVLDESMGTFDYLAEKKALDFNNKLYIKQLCLAHHIPTPDFFQVSGEGPLVKAISSFESRGTPFLCKKGASGGGFGNFRPKTSAQQEESLQWYRRYCDPSESVLVEHFLPFTQVLGTLCFVHSEESIEYVGIDLQRTQNEAWIGMEYPHHPPLSLANLLKEITLKIGVQMAKAGGRGPVNLDFGVVEDRPYLLEVNARTNGFQSVRDLVELVERQKKQGPLHFLYDECCPDSSLLLDKPWALWAGGSNCLIWGESRLEVLERKGKLYA